jgi:hypothetical protein
MSNDSEGPGGGFEVWESRYSRTRLAPTRRFYRALKRKGVGGFLPSIKKEPGILD